MSISVRVTRLGFLVITVLAGCGRISDHDELELALAQPKPSMISVDLQDSLRLRTWHLDQSGLYVIDNTPPMQPDMSGAHAVMLHAGGARRKACDHDMTLDQNGNAVIADKNSGDLLRVNGDDFAISTHKPRSISDTEPLAGLAGITYSPHWRSYFAIDHSGSAIWMMDAQLTRAQPIRLTRPIADPCRLTLPAKVREDVGERVRYRRFCVLSGGRPMSIVVSPLLLRAEAVDRACEVQVGTLPGTHP
jgi:hypothetical protein